MMQLMLRNGYRWAGVTAKLFTKHRLFRQPWDIRHHFDITCLMMRTLGDSNIKTTSWPGAPCVDPALFLHSCFVVPAKASTNRGQTQDGASSWKPAWETRRTIGQGWRQNREEGKVGQGATTIGHECGSTLPCKKCTFSDLPFTEYWPFTPNNVLKVNNPLHIPKVRYLLLYPDASGVFASQIYLKRSNIRALILKVLAAKPILLVLILLNAYPKLYRWCTVTDSMFPFSTFSTLKRQISFLWKGSFEVTETTCVNKGL